MIGIVRWLDPCVLAAHSGTLYTEPWARTSLTSPHRFLCINVDEGCSTWTPLMSRRTEYRVEIPRSIRRCGDTLRGLYWMTGTYWANPENLWYCEDWVVEAAEHSLRRQNWGARVTEIPKALTWMLA